MALKGYTRGRFFIRLGWSSVAAVIYPAGLSKYWRAAGHGQPIALWAKGSHIYLTNIGRDTTGNFSGF
jgi:hypothetical protein